MYAISNKQLFAKKLEIMKDSSDKAGYFPK